MREPTARRLAWGMFSLNVLLVAASIGFNLLTEPIPGQESATGDIIFTVITGSFSIVSILILAQQPRNRIGWILLAIGIFWVIAPASYGDYLISRGLFAGHLIVALASSTWAIPIGLMGTVLLLRFPTGRLLSPRWRAVEWTALAAIGLVTLVITLSPGDLSDAGYPHLRNPLGMEALNPLMDVLTPVLMFIPLTIIASAISVFSRFRRSRGSERLQLKWLAAAGTTVATFYLMAMLVSIPYSWDGPNTPGWVETIQWVALSSFALIPIAIGFAILKHRLYDIDVIINRALVFGMVFGFTILVYVAAVAGVGALVGTGTGSGVAGPIIATAIVGVAFQPLISRARRVADRLVYGRRTTPYEALAALAGPGSVAELAARVARIAVDSTAARRAVVWLRAGQELRPVAWWPEQEDAPSPVRLTDAASVVLPDESYVNPLVSDGNLLGAISAIPGRGETLASADERLLADLAAQSAVALDRALSDIALPEGVITFLMTDVEGSTSLWEENPTAMAHALAEHDAVIEESVSSSGGLLLKSRGEGDSTFSVFTDARAALMAALNIQTGLARQQWATSRPIQVRAALHTGDVQVRDRDYFGPIPNRCARLRSIAHGGQTLLSKPTRDAVVDVLPAHVTLLDLGPKQLKDFNAPENVFQLQTAQRL